MRAGRSRALAPKRRRVCHLMGSTLGSPAALLRAFIFILLGTLGGSRSESYFMFLCLCCQACGCVSGCPETRPGGSGAGRSGVLATIAVVCAYAETGDTAKQQPFARIYQRAAFQSWPRSGRTASLVPSQGDDTMPTVGRGRASEGRPKGRAAGLARAPGAEPAAHIGPRNCWWPLLPGRVERSAGRGRGC